MMGISTTPSIVSTRKNLNVTLYGPLQIEDRFGRIDQAYKFDGVDDFLEVPNDAVLNLQQFTLILTFKILAVPAGPDYASKMTLVAKGLDLGNYNIRVRRYGGSSYPLLSYGHHCSTGNFTAICWGKKLELNKYYQIAATYADKDLRIVVNGVQELEQGNVPEPVPNNETLLVGKSPYANDPEFFNGIIDEVRLCDWAITIAELTSLYQSGMP